MVGGRALHEAGKSAGLISRFISPDSVVEVPGDPGRSAIFRADVLTDHRCKSELLSTCDLVTDLESAFQEQLLFSNEEPCYPAPAPSRDRTIGGRSRGVLKFCLFPELVELILRFPSQ